MTCRFCERVRRFFNRAMSRDGNTRLIETAHATLTVDRGGVVHFIHGHPEDDRQVFRYMLGSKVRDYRVGSYLISATWRRELVELGRVIKISPVA